MSNHKIEISREFSALCQNLGISPSQLFQKMQEHIFKDGSESDETLLIHFYLARSIARIRNLEPSKVEDLLAETLQRVKDRRKVNANYSYSLQSKSS